MGELRQPYNVIVTPSLTNLEHTLLFQEITIALVAGPDLTSQVYQRHPNDGLFFSHSWAYTVVASPYAA